MLGRMVIPEGLSGAISGGPGYGHVVWMTGLPSSGKTTIALHLVPRIVEHGMSCVLLDARSVRTWLTPDLTWSAKDRHENVRRVAHVARLVADLGAIAVVCLVSPYESSRQEAMKIIGKERFTLVYLAATVEEVSKVDHRYEMAAMHPALRPHWTGVTDPYEPPYHKEIELSGALSLSLPSRCAEKILNLLQAKGAL